MNIDIFTLCDNANEYQGKLVIVGTFNTILSREFPATHGALAIVAKLTFHRSERGKKQIQISIRKEDDSTFVLAPADVEIDNSDQQGEIGNINIILNINNLTLPVAGNYIVSLKVDDHVKETILSANKME